MEILKELLNSRAVTGRVEWIGVASERLQPMQAMSVVTALQQCGIDGEHHRRPDGQSKRQVTLIQFEHLECVRQLLGTDEGAVIPELLRRNIVVSGINLAALKHQKFRIGTAILEGSGNCPPCSRMDENLGPGGYAAMLGHGGITAVVLETGQIRLGDPITVVSA